MSKDTGYSDSKKDSQDSRIRELEAQNKKMRETLEFYAEEATWEDVMNKACDAIYGDISASIEEGKRARQCLKEIDEKK